MARYSSKLRLYDSVGGYSLVIDQAKAGSPSTHIDTERDSIVANKPCIAPDFQSTGGGSLSSLDGFSGVPDVKAWITERTGAGANGVVVSPGASGADGTYATIQSAVTAVPNGGVVYVRSGTYGAGAVLDHAKSVSIIGEDQDTVVVEPLGGMAATAFQQPAAGSTATYAIRGLTIRSCGQAIRVASGASCRVADVKVEHVGWDGSPPATDDQAGHSALWEGPSTHDSWAVEVSSCPAAQVERVRVATCSRGIKLEDCGGHLRECEVRDVLGAGFELGASSGDGSTGCSQTRIDNSTVRCARAEGLRVVGGGGVQVTGCVFDSCWWAGAMYANTAHCDMTGTVIARCNSRSYSGTGTAASGEADGSVVARGSAGLGSSDYTLNVSGCTLSCGGSGSQASAFALFAADLDSTVNVSGCGYICFDPLLRVNDMSLVEDSQLSWVASQIHSM